MYMKIFEGLLFKLFLNLNVSTQQTFEKCFVVLVELHIKKKKKRKKCNPSACKIWWYMEKETY
jgi:hypothetical protein